MKTADFPLPDTEWEGTRGFWEAAAREQLAHPALRAPASASSGIRASAAAPAAAPSCPGRRSPGEGRSSPGRSCGARWSPPSPRRCRYVTGAGRPRRGPRRARGHEPGRLRARGAARRAAGARGVPSPGLPEPHAARDRADVHAGSPEPPRAERNPPMSELFRDVASIDYPIIDCDSHVNEPPNLWQERVPARLRERAPRVERTREGRHVDLRRRQGEVAGRAHRRRRALLLRLQADGHHLRDDAPRELRHQGQTGATWTPTASTRRCSTRA